MRLERLDAAGYEQYEISNVARPGLESRHNLKYWQDGEWLGFGCGAHSTRDGVRWKNVASTEEYISRLQTGQAADRRSARALARDAARGGAVYRPPAGRTDSTSIPWGDDTRPTSGRAMAEALQPSLEAGLAVRDGSRLRLSRDGMLLANEILSVFV